MTNQIPIIVINLTCDVEKKNRVTKILNQYNLNFDFFTAVDGEALTAEEINAVYDENKAIKKIRRGLSTGEVGCALSHLGVYQHLLKHNIKQAVILEDDIIISPSFIDSLSMIDYAPKDWELILLGHSDSPTGLGHFCKVNIPLAHNPTQFLIGKPIITVGGTYGYIINQNGANRILSQIGKFYQALDNYTGDYKYTNLYSVYPHTVRVNFNSLSAITASIKTKKKPKNLLHQKISDFNRVRKTHRKWTINCIVKLILYKITSISIAVKLMDERVFYFVSKIIKQDINTD